MKKNGLLGGLILIIAMTVFNVVAFVIPHNSGGVFWCGYIFTMATFLLQILFAFIAFGKADTLKKTFFGLPVAQLGVTYLVLQLIWGLACIFAPIEVKLAIIVSAVLLGVYLVAIISAVIGRDTVKGIDAKIKVKTFFVKSLLVDVETLSTKAESTEIKDALDKLAETVKYSDPMSNEALQSVEGRISDKYNELESLVTAGDAESVLAICEALDVLFVERNKKCKLLK